MVVAPATELDIGDVHDIGKSQHHFRTNFRSISLVETKATLSHSESGFRTGRDSNPRCPFGAHTLSRRARSTTPAPVLVLRAGNNGRRREEIQAEMSRDRPEMQRTSAWRGSRIF